MWLGTCRDIRRSAPRRASPNANMRWRWIEISPTPMPYRTWQDFYRPRRRNRGPHRRGPCASARAIRSAYTWLTTWAWRRTISASCEQAVAWCRRAIEANRNYPQAHFQLAAALAQLGRLDEARSAVKAGLALNPSFTVSRARADWTAMSDDPTYPQQLAPIFEGLRMAGLPGSNDDPPKRRKSHGASSVRLDEARSPGHRPGHLEYRAGESEAAIAALRRGLDLGMTHIDTAEMYGSGAAEDLVGEAIAGRRDEVFLVSKVLPQNASRKRDDRRLRAVAQAAQDRPPRLLPSALARVASPCGHGRGLRAAPAPTARSCPGASAISMWPISMRPEIAGAGRLACNQVLYHLRERAIEHAVIPWCEEQRRRRRRLQPVRPRGGFPGPHSRGRPGAEGDRRPARGDAAPGRAALPDAAAVAVRDPQGFEPGACRRRTRAPARSISAPPSSRAIDAAFPLGPRPRSLPML